MTRLSLFFFGSFTAALDERVVVDFRYDKVRALLALLAFEPGRSYRRETLIGLFWPDLTDEAARTNLRQALTTLRTAIDDRDADPPFLQISRESIQWNPESDVWSDVAAFGELCQISAEHRHRSMANCTTCANRYVQAVQLYSGDFLEQFFLPDSAPFEEWAALKREALRRQMLEALSLLMTYYERHGEYELAERYARRLLELEPWHEGGLRHLMRLLVVRGLRNQALAQYERVRQMLEEELGVEPDAETATLYEQIRGQSPSVISSLRVPSERSHNLPPQPTPFVGRDHELNALATLLDNPACHLLTLLGVGGIGKTRLALQAATQQLDAFADGVFFVPLASLSSEDMVVAAMAEAIQCPLSGAEAGKVQLLRSLHDKELLFVLDNFEHLLERTHLLTEILATAPNVTLLITSRERLRLQSEWLFDVEGLSYPSEESVPAVIDDKALFDRYGAMKLFIRTACRLHPSFDPSPADLQAIAAICQIVEGMPLAIELGAAWVRVLSCQEIAQEIRQGIDILSQSLQDVPERHRSLRAVFDHSWNLLSIDEQRVFRRLSVFQSGCTREAAAQIAGASPMILAGLIDKSLLRRTPEERYELHELLRQYGIDMLQGADEVRETRDRHLAYFRHLAQQAEPHLTEVVSVFWLDRLEAEHDNLRYALTWSLIEGNAEIGLDLATRLWLFWWMRGYTVEGRDWLRILLRENAEAPPLLRARALRAAGALAYYLTDLEAAEQYFGKALWLFRDVNDEDGISRSLRNLAVALGDQGKFTQARPYAEESLVLARQLEDPQNLANALSDLGVLHYYLGDTSQALPYLEESLALDRTRGDPHDIAIRLHNLAEVVAADGVYARAVPLLQESIALFRETQNRYGVAFSLHARANVEILQGGLSQAQNLLEEAVAIFRELGEQQGLALCLLSFAELTGKQERAEQATRLLGVVNSLVERKVISLKPPDRARYKWIMEAIRPQLDANHFAENWEAGRALTLDQALNDVLPTS